MEHFANNNPEHHFNHSVKFVKPVPGRHLIKPDARKPGLYQGTLFEIEKPKLARKKKKLTWCSIKHRLDTVRAFYELGIEGSKWYDATFGVINEIFGRNRERTVLFIKFLAATSPLNGIVDNVNLALKAMTLFETFGIADTQIRKLKCTEKEHRNGCRDVHFKDWTIWEREFEFDAHRYNLIRIMRGEPLSGPKVTAFEANLMGDPDSVTVDRWMMRAFNDSTQLVNGRCEHAAYKDTDDAPSEPDYRCIEDAVRKLAYEAGVQPRQYQAAVWVGIKMLCGNPEDTADPFHSVLERVYHSPQLKFDFAGLEEVFKDDMAEQGIEVHDRAEQEFAAFEAALGNVAGGEMPDGDYSKNPDDEEATLTDRILGGKLI